MFESLLSQIGPKIIFLICDSCNIIADYYQIEEPRTGQKDACMAG